MSGLFRTATSDMSMSRDRPSAPKRSLSQAVIPVQRGLGLFIDPVRVEFGTVIYLVSCHPDKDLCVRGAHIFQRGAGDKHRFAADPIARVNADVRMPQLRLSISKSSRCQIVPSVACMW